MLDTLSPVNPSMSYSKSNRKRYALSPASVNSPVLSNASPTHPSPCNNSSNVFIFLNLSFFFPFLGAFRLPCRERFCMQDRQRVKIRKGKETVRDLTEYPTLRGTGGSSSIWEGCRSIREPVSVAVLDGWTDAVPLHGKITPTGNAEAEERSMAHDKSGQKSRNKKAGRQGHTKGCSAFQGIRLKQGAGTGKRIVMT